MHDPAIPETTIVKDPRHVKQRLRDLGLTPRLIRGTAEAWQQLEAMVSPFEPRNAPGLKGWISGAGFCREHLALEPGWERSDPMGVPMSVNTDLGIAVTVTSGNNLTGFDFGHRHPSTKNPKGAATVTAVIKNSKQLDMWEQLGSGLVVKAKTARAKSTSKVLTWFVLIYVDSASETVRSEVSLPAGIEGGRVTRWLERILVADVPKKPTRSTSAHDGDVDGVLDVPVRRRKA